MILSVEHLKNKQNISFSEKNISTRTSNLSKCDQLDIFSKTFRKLDRDFIRLELSIYCLEKTLW